MRRGAITGLIVGGVIHLLFWLGALHNGQPLVILPMMLVGCSAVGAVAGVFRKKGPRPGGSSPR